MVDAVVLAGAGGVGRWVLVVVGSLLLVLDGAMVALSEAEEVEIVNLIACSDDPVVRGGLVDLDAGH